MPELHLTLPGNIGKPKKGRNYNNNHRIGAILHDDGNISTDRDGDNNAFSLGLVKMSKVLNLEEYPKEAFVLKGTGNYSSTRNRVRLAEKAKAANTAANRDFFLSLRKAKFSSQSKSKF
tara:strand:- start:444 stop:800 length:357 start_codon:yes stop_codon:yes gene_type:complete